ncbi:type II DNA topoisomerase VI subunit [Artemisia annua]|uniref:Type II DNA topoisomerase VI subunit n=1 Tax=Artemisia annua TaxID=35608 RepID=A0A2U1PE52_ARTAN|nr:type II DNA topoisomerase VI subunit [Artemisia annua]
MSDFEVVACRAKFILVVEKEAYYSSLVEDEINKKVDCILIIGHGMPDMATRYFLQHLTKQVNIPVFGLVDCDPFWVSILCTYTCGSENSVFDCDNLVTPGIKWLGVRPSDLDKYVLMSDPFDESKILERLMKKDFLNDKASWMEELEKKSKEMRRCDLVLLNCETVLQKVLRRIGWVW